MKCTYYIPEVELWVDRHYGYKKYQGGGQESPDRECIELAKFYIQKVLRPRKTYNAYYDELRLPQECSKYLQTKIERGDFIAAMYESGYVPNKKGKWKVGFQPFYKSILYRDKHVHELFHTILIELEQEGKDERYVCEVMKKQKSMYLNQSVPDQYKMIMRLHKNWILS